jgi:hypothetical protein
MTVADTLIILGTFYIVCLALPAMLSYLFGRK